MKWIRVHFINVLKKQIILQNIHIHIDIELDMCYFFKVSYEIFGIALKPKTEETLEKLILYECRRCKAPFGLNLSGKRTG